MISLNRHNLLDYAMGIFLLLCPFLFAFADIDVARYTFFISGFLVILYSLLTDYEYSVLKVSPLGVHMTLDVLIGAFIFLAPWILGYRGLLTTGQEYLHYIVGLAV